MNENLNQYSLNLKKRRKIRLKKKINKMKKKVVNLNLNEKLLDQFKIEILPKDQTPEANSQIKKEGFADSKFRVKLPLKFAIKNSVEKCSNCPKEFRKKRQHENMKVT